MKLEISKKIFIVLVLLIILTGFILRFYKLDLRPLHHDEGVNSTFMMNLIKDGSYEYNPENFHGPLLYYISYIPLSIFGLKNSVFETNSQVLADYSFRLAPAFFGVILIILFFFLKDFLGKVGTISSMILMTLSPSFLYFSRDNIHEIYLLTFTLTAFISGYFFYKTKRIKYLYFTFVSIALMFTLKETTIITLCIMALSLVLTKFISVFLDKEQKAQDYFLDLLQESVKKILRPIPIVGILISLFTVYTIFLKPGEFADKAHELWHYSLASEGVSVITCFLLFSFLFKALRNRTIHILLGSLVFFLVIIMFFSSLFSYQQGISSFFVAFEKWLSQGTVESQHTKPFFYFLKILFESESPILFFGILALLFSIKRNNPVIIFTSVWAILTFFINSFIPYKTPWLVLNLLLPFIILSGKFIQDLVSNIETRKSLIMFMIVSLLIISRNSYTAIDLSFINYDNDANELIYVQTNREAKELIQKTIDLTKNYQDEKTKIHIIPSDLWPLPWYFRDFTKIMYNDYSDASIIIVSTDHEKKLEKNLKNRYKKEQFPLRPGVNLSFYYESKAGDKFADEYRFTKPVNLQNQKINLQPGLKAKVYPSTSFSGNILEEKVDTIINFQYNQEIEKPYKAPFSITWEGFIFATRSGNYIFITESDDGSWIYINNKLIVDNSGVHGTQRVLKSVFLEKGYHRIRVKYFDNYFGAIMRLKWQPPYRGEELISGKNLFHLEYDKRNR